MQFGRGTGRPVGRTTRAGCPIGRRIGEKTGSGDHAESTDITVIRPPHHTPLVLTVFTAPEDPGSTTGRHTVAEQLASRPERLGPGAQPLSG
ncbi:hypothetical protein GCM10014715_58700 [Streptomyces spiralis]|uniref:Uncharacterized protein n=1 Tax=Streptomyces spiralis TaxID=66376 RepID=A0A919A9I9_9ACTN|nr:hypothetical protein GCM10014715_58700 [Streptomyces spiralis]